MAAVQKDMIVTAPGMQNYFSLPVKGLKYNEVIDELDRLSALGEVDWRQGKISGTVYHGGKDLSRLITEAFSLFTVSNVSSFLSWGRSFPQFPTPIDDASSNLPKLNLTN